MLRWRIFGISFCIMPSFWLMNALWGYMLSGAVQGGRRGVLAFMVVWILCTLVSVMAHELGHVLMGRVFGQPGNVTLGGLGGQAVGDYGNISPWKRILVIFAGPGAGFMFLAFLVAVDSAPWDGCMEWLDWPRLKIQGGLIARWDPDFTIRANGYYMLVMQLLIVMNLIWNIINLFPIIPMDGGMIFREVACMISPQGGLKFAYAVSLLLAGIITAYHIAAVLVLYEVVHLPFKLWTFAFPEITLIMFAMMTYQSFMALRQSTMMQRHSQYAQGEDDDRSGPRHPRGVEEVPVKDPDDFAPRAPGSESPRR
jgi:stage IV sporulation protein FB